MTDKGAERGQERRRDHQLPHELVPRAPEVVHPPGGAVGEPQPGRGGRWTQGEDRSIIVGRLVVDLRHLG